MKYCTRNASSVISFYRFVAVRYSREYSCKHWLWIVLIPHVRHFEYINFRNCLCYYAFSSRVILTGTYVGKLSSFLFYSIESYFRIRDTMRCSTVLIEIIVDIVINALCIVSRDGNFDCLLEKMV